MRGRGLQRWLALSVALAAGCGYSLTAAGGLTGGVERAGVAPFENRSAEPELGAALAAALREELARRGALAGVEPRAEIRGEVTATAPTPAAPGGASWRVTVEVRARLVQDGRLVAERNLRREADYAAGLDALETEGRRALALHKLAVDCARDLAVAFAQ